MFSVKNSFLILLLRRYKSVIVYLPFYPVNLHCRIDHQCTVFLSATYFSITFFFSCWIAIHTTAEDVINHKMSRWCHTHVIFTFNWKMCSYSHFCLPHFFPVDFETSWLHFYLTVGNKSPVTWMWLIFHAWNQVAFQAQDRCGWFSVSVKKFRPNETCLSNPESLSAIWVKRCVGPVLISKVRCLNINTNIVVGTNSSSGFYRGLAIQQLAQFESFSKFPQGKWLFCMGRFTPNKCITL